MELLTTGTVVFASNLLISLNQPSLLNKKEALIISSMITACKGVCLVARSLFRSVMQGSRFSSYLNKINQEGVERRNKLMMYQHLGMDAGISKEKREKIIEKVKGIRDECVNLQIHFEKQLKIPIKYFAQDVALLALTVAVAALPFLLKDIKGPAVFEEVF